MGIFFIEAVKKSPGIKILSLVIGYYNPIPKKEQNHKIVIFAIFSIRNNIFKKTATALRITLIHKKNVEVIARQRIQNFMLTLGNLIITPHKNQNSVV